MKSSYNGPTPIRFVRATTQLQWDRLTAATIMMTSV